MTRMVVRMIYCMKAKMKWTCHNQNGIPKTMASVMNLTMYSINISKPTVMIM